MPATESLIDRLLRAARYALPVIVVLIIAGAWYSDVLLGALAPRPKAADIAGEWRLDEGAYRSMAEGVARSVPEGPARERYLASLLARADSYRSAVYRFTPEGYTITTPQGIRDFPATYEGFPPNSLAIRPQGGSPMAILIDEPSKRITINLPMVGMPLKPVE